MVGRHALGALLAVALVPAGCGLLAAVPASVEPTPSPAASPGPTVPPLPSPETAPSPVAAAIPSDAPVPYSLRAAVEPARRFLLARRAAIGSQPVALRFVRGYCAVGAQGALAFEQLPADGSAPAASPAYALAFADDIAAGIIAGAWFAVFDVPDLAAQPDLVEIFEDRGIPCP